MKRSALLVLASIVIATGCTTHAMNKGTKGNMMMHMANMDKNADGVLSRDEFMTAHEAMFDRMKNEDGVVKLDEMPASCAGMMNSGGMMHGGGMMRH